MWVCCLFQISKVPIHIIVIRIGQLVFIALTLPLVEIHMHLPHVVKQIADTDCIRLLVKRIFIGFHGISSTKFLTPEVGRQTRNQEVTLHMPANLILSLYHIFRYMSNVFYYKIQRPSTSPS